MKAPRQAKLSPGTEREAANGGSREKLLEALRDLMVERDSLEVTLGEVAKRAGINHALVGYYFGSKEGMLLALLREGTRDTPGWLEALLKADRTPPEKLRAHLRGIINSYAAWPVIGVLTDYLLRTGSPEVVHEVTRTIITPLVKFYEAVIREGVASGHFHPVEPLFLHMQIIGACNFMFFNHARLQIGYGLTEVTPTMRQRFIDYLSDGILRAIAA